MEPSLAGEKILEAIRKIVIKKEIDGLIKN
jgi:hypothetical protein